MTHESKIKDDGRRVWRLTALLLGLYITALPPAVSEPCTDCGKPAFPEASARLAMLGYPPDRFAVLMAWEETAPADRTQMLEGYHVLPKDGGPAFDLYLDATGRIVEESHLAKWGVTPKNWELKPRETPMKPLAPGVKTLPNTPVPTAVSPSATVTLPLVNRTAIEAEDTRESGDTRKGLTRIGVFQDIAPPIRLAGNEATHGEWQDLPDGSRIWSAELRSEGALGLRVHFSRITMPNGAEAMVYNAETPSEAYGPYTTPPPGESDLWAASCFGERIVVECRVPAGTPANALALHIDKVIYIYRGFDTLPWAKAGACNLDVTCYPAWAGAARAVGGIGSIGDTGYLWCTGSLIADTDPTTDIPYFITANHCVGAQEGFRGASSIEVYWLFQTSACDGLPPPASSVPRTTGGADYLAGSPGNASFGGGNDFTLLRLRNQPPGGLAYLGWSIVAQPLQRPVTCIHHPTGSFKRISFASLTNTDNNFPSLYYEVLYSLGTTEHGSSGCPLMLTETGQFIGQLWGGGASCTNMNFPDYYGRFDVTFPIVRNYLDPVPLIPFADFSEAEYIVGETAGSVLVEVRISLPPGSPASVEYATADGTAAAGRDYAPVAGTLVFEGTIQSKTFSVPIYDNTHTESDRTIRLILSNPSGCELPPTGNNPATITILDDDLDSDGDGLSDYDEIHAVYGYFTDPFNPDTDSDGYSDYEEIMGSIHGIKSDPTQFTAIPALSVPYFTKTSDPWPRR